MTTLGKETGLVNHAIRLFSPKTLWTHRHPAWYKLGLETKTSFYNFSIFLKYHGIPFSQKLSYFA
jgi:hypothetical protein